MVKKGQLKFEEEKEITRRSKNDNNEKGGKETETRPILETGHDSDREREMKNENKRNGQRERNDKENERRNIQNSTRHSSPTLEF